ncbi:MAG: hypothetical protein RLZZ01_1483, partial [Actinomycetota bacterium]
MSPDGHRVAHVVSTIDVDQNRTVTRIWLDGRPISAGPSDSSPVWSPDGRLLAFTSRRGERSSDATLHVMPVDWPGEVRTICSMPDGITSPAWSPDGARIAFTSRTRHERYEAADVSWQSPRKIERFFSRLNGEDWVHDRPAHVYLVDADGTGFPRNLTPDEFQYGQPSWTPDSSALIVSAARHADWDIDLAVDLHRLDLDGTLTALTDRTGSYHHPAVSPDGTTIAFLGLDDPLTYPQNGKVGVMRTDGADRRWISERLDRTFTPFSGLRAPIWIDDRRVVAAAEDRGEQHLFVVDLDGSAPTAITTGAMCVAGHDIAAGVVATAETTVDRTAEIVIERDGVRHQLTKVSRRHLGWERFSVPCTDGTDEIDAWIMRPDGFDPAVRHPVLLNVHGGPFTQYGESFFDEAQMQARAGFVVLMSNPRGGSGRHSAWGQAIMGPKHPVVSGTGWGSV